MSVESAIYIGQLDPTNPPGGGPKSEGDDHLRLIKAALKATFPNFGTAAVLATETELSRLSGVTSGVQAQLDAKASSASAALTGNPTAPTQADGSGGNWIATGAYVETAIARVNLGGLSATQRRRNALAVLNFIDY